MMHKEHLAYVVDIGNTRIHCGLVNYESRQCLFKEEFPSQELLSYTGNVIEKLSTINGNGNCIPVIIAGGNKTTFSEIELQLRPKDFQCIHFQYTPKMPFTLVYKNNPGADRLAHTLFAMESFPGHDCILISAGTAITVDLVFKGQFIGGTIAPGISTQLKSLSNAAPVLPLVTPEGPIPLPGDSTETCIRSGILYGVAGGIQKIISHYRTISPEALILATGGDWPYLSGLIDMSISFNKDMTLIGIALAKKHL
jgi:pantothenate kinase type III